MPTPTSFPHNTSSVNARNPFSLLTVFGKIYPFINPFPSSLFQHQNETGQTNIWSTNKQMSFPGTSGICNLISMHLFDKTNECKRKKVASRDLCCFLLPEHIWSKRRLDGLNVFLRARSCQTFWRARLIARRLPGLFVWNISNKELVAHCHLEPKTTKVKRQTLKILSSIFLRLFCIHII